MINSKDISVVVQGAVDKIETKKCLNSIRKFLPSAEIILSTWEGSDVLGMDYDDLVLNKDPGAANLKPITTKFSNVNREIVSTLNGIKKAQKEYCLKIRSDAKIKNLKFLKYFDSLNVQNLKKEKQYSVFESRMLIDSYFTRNPETFVDSIPDSGLCFHPSDLWFFGLKNDLKNLFDIPLQEKYIVDKITGGGGLYRTPEQYIWISCLEKNGWCVDMRDCFYNTPLVMELSLKSIINNFFVLNHKDTGIEFPKKFKDYPNFTFTYVLDTARYYELYKKYCDNNFKIPLKFRFANAKDFCKRLVIFLGIEKETRSLMDSIRILWNIVKIPYCIFVIFIKTILNSYKIARKVV